MPDLSEIVAPKIDGPKAGHMRAKCPVLHDLHVVVVQPQLLQNNTGCQSPQSSWKLLARWQQRCKTLLG